jgi:hypothetical protein
MATVSSRALLYYLKLSVITLCSAGKGKNKTASEERKRESKKEAVSAKKSRCFKATNIWKLDSGNKGKNLAIQETISCPQCSKEHEGGSTTENRIKCCKYSEWWHRDCGLGRE